jgi:hypothetical protein
MPMGLEIANVAATAVLAWAVTTRPGEASPRSPPGDAPGQVRWATGFWPEP